LSCDADVQRLVSIVIERASHGTGGDDRHLVLRGASPEHDGDAALPAHAFSSARPKSSITSSGSSRPTLTRMRPSPIPAARRASGSSCRGGVLAAWLTRVLRPPRLVPTQ